jgi:ABC-type dipeptide/oligopeptide/nickel transport system permease component
MKKDIIRRLLLVPPMLLVISILSFLAIGLVPRSNFDLISISDDSPTPDELWHRLDNDQPIWLHYLRWMGIVKQPDGSFRGILEGYLGQSIWSPENDFRK